MKKSIFLLSVALGLLTACDPIKDEATLTPMTADAEELRNSITFTQYSQEDNTTPQADGNFIVYSTSPARIVSILTKDGNGDENLLAYGSASGSFLLAPPRGSDPQQTVYVRVVESDGTIVEAQKSLTVAVATDLSPEVRLLCSNSGTKVWKWDTSTGRSWGNGAYVKFSGTDFAENDKEVWWGCMPEDLTGQLGHSDTGEATGEEDSNAYMEFTEDGKILTYDKDGKLIRQGTYSVSQYNNGEYVNVEGQPWKVGTLTTTAGAILFPFKINGGGEKPTEFDIIKLSTNQLILVHGGNGGSGTECTWWRFTSASDGEGMLTDYSSKNWTWDTSTNRSWGNGAYAKFSGIDFVENDKEVWWGCIPEDLTGQLGHSDTGVATGEEDSNAYMTFDWANKTITTYDGTGKQIRNGSFEITWNKGAYITDPKSGNPWSLGTLNTTAGAILFPFKINGGGERPTEFEILKLTDDQLVLVYSGNGKDTGSECTWWKFKKK